VEIQINNQNADPPIAGRLFTISRTWQAGDTVTVRFGARVRTSRWVQNSVAIERGPLVYVLRIAEKWRSVRSREKWGDYQEVHPASPWNYGLLESAVNDPAKGFELTRKAVTAYPWTSAQAPLELRTQGKRIPEWELYNHRAGPLPHSRPHLHLEKKPAEDIVLLPYGCTRLRITEFPVVR
jgi:hypothetical protein